MNIESFLLGALSAFAFYGALWIIVPMFSVRGPLRHRLSFGLLTAALLVWPPLMGALRQVHEKERLASLSAPTDEELLDALMASILNHREVGRIKFNPDAMRQALAKHLVGESS